MKNRKSMQEKCPFLEKIFHKYSLNFSIFLSLCHEIPILNRFYDQKTLFFYTLAFFSLCNERTVVILMLLLLPSSKIDFDMRGIQNENFKREMSEKIIDMGFLLDKNKLF